MSTIHLHQTTILTPEQYIAGLTSAHSHAGLIGGGFGLHGDEGCRIEVIHGNDPSLLMH